MGTPPTVTTLVSDTAETSITCCYCSRPHFSTMLSLTLKQGSKFSIRVVNVFRVYARAIKVATAALPTNVALVVVVTIQVPHQPDNDCPPVSQPSTTSSLNPNAPEFSPPSSNSLYINVSQAVLLQTALVEVYNPANPSFVRRMRVCWTMGANVRT